MPTPNLDDNISQEGSAQIGIIERAAIAMAADKYGSVDEFNWRIQSDAWKQSFLDMARAAITAIRVPTQTMIGASGADGIDYLSVDDATQIWQAMIDEALK